VIGMFLFQNVQNYPVEEIVGKISTGKTPGVVGFVAKQSSEMAFTVEQWKAIQKNPTAMSDYKNINNRKSGEEFVKKYGGDVAKYNQMYDYYQKQLQNAAASKQYGTTSQDDLDKKVQNQAQNFDNTMKPILDDAFDSDKRKKSED